MSARRRLNGGYAAGFLALAAPVGAATGSGLAFAVSPAALLGIDQLAGNIRPFRR